MNARSQVSCGPATTPGARSLSTVLPFITSSHSVPEQRQNTARVPPAVTVRVFSSSATVGRAPFAGLAGRASTFFTSSWSRATA